jgi:Ca2+-binding RTX toxin-like protein
VAATASPAAVAVFARGGDDTVTAAGPVKPRLIFFGGDGNDVLNAGTALGPVVLSGGAGDDSLTGGAGRDILIGGAGADVLDGGANDDVALGEGATLEADPLGLRKLSLEWARTSAPYETRRDHLLGVLPHGTNGKNVLAAVADTSVDALTGGAGRDWFFDAMATPNVLQERAADETVTTI